MLSPLSENSERKPEKYVVFDIEVRDWTNFLCIGFYDGNRFLWWDSIRDFFEYLFSRNEDLILYAHFGGKFDFLFLFQYLYFETDYEVGDMLPRGSGILCFQVTHEGHTFSFRDSSAMLPFSLRHLCENFKVDHPKLEWDHEKTTGVTKELIEYLEHDCIGLYECIERYFSWPLIQRAGSSFTIAGQAMRVLRLFLKRPIASLSKDDDEFTRGAYFGGRTEIFKPLFSGDRGQTLTGYDVNSLYPTVMRLHDYPTSFSHYTRRYYGDRLGVYDAEVEVPEMYVPPLGTVLEIDGEKKFIFPTGRFRGRWTTWELEYAKSVGVKVLSTGRGILFNSGGKFFQPYVDSLYEIREKAEKNSVDSLIAKLLLNSCYGRFGLRRDRESIVFDDGQLGFKALLEIKKIDSDLIARLGTVETEIQTFTNVAVACFVTSASRIYMHKNCYTKSEKDLYYTDTDSIFTTATFDSSDKGLGALKREGETKKAACFLLPKTYIIQGEKDEFSYLDEKGKKVKTDRKIVMKGFDKKKIQHFGMEDFYTALEGDLRRLTAKSASGLARFKTSARKGGFISKVEAASRAIRSSYTKRQIVRLGRGEFDTVPLHIEDGQVMNHRTHEGDLRKPVQAQASLFPED
jgi:hypothetical protein